MASNNSLNTQSQFPNIDQLGKSERGMFMKEHEFETSLQTMISELNSLLDTNSSSESAIESESASVQKELNILIGRIESEIVSLVERYIEQMKEENDQIEAAYERLYSKIYSIIQSINVNIQNRTTTYDIVMSYKLRILNEIESKFGIKSPYSDGRSNANGEKYSIQSTGTLVRLRDVDEGVSWRSMPVIIDPNITQDKVIKICEFTPVTNGTNIPAFLAEVNVSGDLFAFKGILKSVTQNRDTRFNESAGRSAEFIAEYFINQDLPFAIKVLYDKYRNKVAVALKYDETEDGFTSIIKFDFSINLLVGTELEFANESTCVIMDGAGLNAYNVTAEPGDSYITVLDYPSKVTHGGSISCSFDVGAHVQITSAFENAEDTLDFVYEDEYTYTTGDNVSSTLPYFIDKGSIDEMKINGFLVDLEKDVTVSTDPETHISTISVKNPANYGTVGIDVTTDVKLNKRYTQLGNILTTHKYGFPDLSLDSSKVSVKVNGANLSANNWDFDNDSGLLQVNNITGDLSIILYSSITKTSEEISSTSGVSEN